MKIVASFRQLSHSSPTEHPANRTSRLYVKRASEMQSTTALTGVSPTTVVSNLPFEASPSVDPPKIEPAPSKSKMSFPWRKAKSRDEDEAEDAEDAQDAELKRLENKVAFLEKKKALLKKIKKIERHDDDTDGTRSPKRKPSFKIRRWKCDDSIDDDLSFEDDNSPLMKRFHSALDCIEDSCSPLINELKDFPAVCGEVISPSETPEKPKRFGFRKLKSARADDKTVASDAPEDLQQSVALTEPIANITRQISRNFLEFPGEIAQLLREEKSAQNDTRSKNRDGAQVPHNDEQAFGWMEQATTMFRSQSLAPKDDASIGLDCFEMLGGKAKDPKVGITDTSKELNAQFVKVTVGARALSGLSVTSKKSDEELPPVHVVLSVLKNTISNEGSSGDGASFAHLPSLRVVKDPSREQSKKNKCHVMGVWDLGKEDEASVTFPRLTGISTFGEGAKQDKDKETRPSPSMVNLRVCIKREGSSELLPIGVAKVLVSGEARDAELAIPIKTEYYKSLGELTKKLNRKPPQSRWESLKTFLLEDEDEPLTCVRFKGFKNETYRLEKDSFIRIKLQVTPDVPKQQSDQESVPIQDTKLEKYPVCTELDKSNDNMKADAEVVTPAIELQMTLPVESALQKNQKSKKSFFKKNKPTENKSDKEDNHSAALIGAGAAAAAGIGIVTLVAAEGNEDNMADLFFSLSGDSVDKNTSKHTEDVANADRKIEDEGKAANDDMILVEEGSAEKAATGKSKKSWFKKTKKTDFAPECSETANADLLGTGAAALALGATNKNEGDANESNESSESPGAVSGSAAADEGAGGCAVAATAGAVNETEVFGSETCSSPMAEDKNDATVDPLVGDASSDNPSGLIASGTSKSKKSWFKKTKKAEVETAKATNLSYEPTLDDTKGDVDKSDIALASAGAAGVALVLKEVSGCEADESLNKEGNTDTTVDRLVVADASNTPTDFNTPKQSKGWFKTKKTKPSKASSPCCVSELNETEPIPPDSSVSNEEGISCLSFSDGTANAEPNAEGDSLKDGSLVGNVNDLGSNVCAQENDSSNFTENPITNAEAVDINKSRESWYKKLTPRKSKAARAPSENGLDSQPVLNELATMDDGQTYDIEHLSLAATLETLDVLHQHDFGCQPEPTPDTDFVVTEPESASKTSVAAVDSSNEAVSLEDVVPVKRSLSTISFGVDSISCFEQSPFCEDDCSIAESEQCGLSECRSEDCMKEKEGKSKVENEEVCLGIELELKHGPLPEDLLEQKPEHKQSPLRSPLSSPLSSPLRRNKKVSGLAGKLSRARSTKSKAPDEIFSYEI